MATDKSTVGITVEKTWLFWPVFRIVRRMVRMGLIQPKPAANTAVKLGMRIR